MSHNYLIRKAGICLIAAVVLACFTMPLSAQYFGQNKVRYETLDWQVLKTEHLNIYYYQQESSTIDEFGRMAERWYTRLSTILQYQLPPNQPIVVYADHPDFRGTTVISGHIGETTGGVTEGLKRRVVLPFAGPLAETDHVLGHELVHAFQYAITSPRDTQGLGMGTPGAVALPLWFIEGMAEYLSLGPEDAQTAMWVRDAIIREEFPTIKDLNKPRYFPYRFGQAFWAYVGGRFGDEAIGEMLKVAGQARSVEPAIRQVLGMSTEELSEDWRQAMIDRYEPVLQATENPDQFGERIVTEDENGGRINTSPMLSPDGRWMVFFSEKDLFSIDLFLMDVDKREVVGKLTRTALDPHVDSLQFVSTSGAWSPDSSRFAFISIREGKPALAIYDIQQRQVTRRIRFDDLGEVLNPTWSADGEQIAFSAIHHGVTDLFVVDLSTEQRRQLTSDDFADLQPAWSPEGSTLAFVTDRFTSDPTALEHGEYRLAAMNVDTGDIREIRGFPVGKHTNPQWSADGSGLYFISDRDGIANIYHSRADGADIRQVTNVRTGVSGISSLTPAFSLAASANRLVFSAFREGGYDIYLADTPQTLAGFPVEDRWSGRLAAMLPPRDTASGDVAVYLGSPRTGLSGDSGFESTEYHPSLSLDYIAPPNISLGVSSFGTAVGGGTALYWSDLLEQHQLMTAFQTTNATSGEFLNNLSAVAGYQNQHTRWTWGFVGGQMPFVTGGLRTTVTNVDGQPVVVRDEVISWQINREAAGTLSYPFNRARRIEFSGGFRSIDFDAKLQRSAYDYNTGQFLGKGSQDLPTPETINMGTASTAMVYDTSIFGGTSPIMGTRYRLEFGGVAGGLNYTNALADYRRYFRVADLLTLAGRLMHYGRYGGDAEDPRLQDIFLGYPSLVRGYTAGSFDATECGPATESGNSCPVFDQLLGSRLAVGNVEARIPVLGTLGVLKTPYLPPVETAFFYDAGITWHSVDDNSVFQGARTPVTSYGASLRMNIFGFAIGQLSYVQPLDRPMESWHWEFAFIPGF